jgi:hypothetical protein
VETSAVDGGLLEVLREGGAAGNPSTAHSVTESSPDADGTAVPYPSADLEAGAPGAAVAENLDARGSPVTSEALVTDEPLYLRGRRPHPAGTMAMSQDDAVIAEWNRGGYEHSIPIVQGHFGKEHPLHTAPRVMIDMTLSAHPSATEEEVEKQVRAKGYWPVRLCYESGLRRLQTLNGTLTFRFDIDHKGKLTHVQPAEKPFADHEVATCIAKGLATLSVAPPPKRSIGRSTVTIQIYPGDEPIYLHSPVIRTSDPTAEDPALRPVREALRDVLPHVRECYTAGLVQHPGLWGRMAVALTVDERGAISGAEEIESQFPDSNVTRCVIESLRAARVQALPAGALAASMPGSEKGAGQPLPVVVAYRLGTLPKP